MKYTIKALDITTHECEVTIPFIDIKKTYDDILSSVLKDVSIEGFRKGKAPKHLAEKQIDKQKIYEQVLHKILPDIYKSILEKEKLIPIVQPKITLKKAREQEDWIFLITISEKPKFTLPDYKKICENVKAEFKKDDIWVPGKKEKKDDKEISETKTKTLNKILETLLANTNFQLSEHLTADEYSRRMTSLLDEIHKAGLTIDSYATSKGLTPQSLQDSLKKEIHDTYKLEFILDEIADKENISIEQKDLDTFFETIADKEKKEEMKKNAYMYAILLRRQKLLDFLLSL